MWSLPAGGMVSPGGMALPDYGLRPFRVCRHRFGIAMAIDHAAAEKATEVPNGQWSNSCGVSEQQGTGRGGRGERRAAMATVGMHLTEVAVSGGRAAGVESRAHAPPGALPGPAAGGALGTVIQDWGRFCSGSA
ncbi:hypothetical protein AAFF_G00278000 [Aldrovandia affinis]|uniref:Uncharacterized protein n=1 Tax=Aldrovandia affinis TaxID=143900 RepID=A0AAD7SSX7_9TELE|nr:hypothetical protein AAFF_G00278000 [Aldrovandia affinis]